MPATQTWSPSGRPGLRPHNRLLRLSRLLRHYRPSTPGTSRLATSGWQVLPLTPTVIDAHGRAARAVSYVDRFACDWHRLAGVWEGGRWCRSGGRAPSRACHDRRNHGPGRTPYEDVRRPARRAVGNPRKLHARPGAAERSFRVAAT